MLGSGLEGTMALALGVIVFAGLALILTSQGAARRGASTRGRVAVDDRAGSRAPDQAIYLFEDGELLDATPKARALLSTGDTRIGELDRLLAMLAPLFPDIAERVRTPVEPGRYRSRVADGLPGRSTLPLAEAEVEHLNGRVRLTLIDTAPEGPEHPLALAVLREEMAVLQRMAAETETLSWCEDTGGTITWANSAYLAFADDWNAAKDTMGPVEPALPVWPPSAVFPPLVVKPEPPAPVRRDVRRRLKVTDATGRITGWFDVRSLHHDGSTMHFANDARDLVAAEEQGRLFVQTLTETFAHLSIGLAIFDNGRRLSTFNPALLDLTRLSAAFLSGRPTLAATLDKLREVGVLQEPRDYRAWKRDITALVDAARLGTFCETWSLTGGQTYRVTGRPHPNGAIAFLFEDISAEISLTRAFRAEIETAQAVLDTLDEAVGVFSPAGTLTACNARFEADWLPGADIGRLDVLSLAQSLAHWQTQVAPTPFWDRLRSFILSQESREPIRAHLRRTDGRATLCRLTPLPGGATLLGFSETGGLPESAAETLPVDTRHAADPAKADGQVRQRATARR